MSRILIEKLSEDRVEIVQDLASKIWPDTFRTILSPEQIRYMLNWMYDHDTLKKQMLAGHQFFVCFENGTPLGFIGVEPFHPDTQKIKIHKLYVLPESQGKGIGKLLFEKAKELASLLKLTSIVLNVNRFNNAVDFYKHLGFTVAYEEDIDIGNGYWMEDYVMSYPLKLE
ncbi:MAG: GNAT family N-acetyltransferase [Flavobacteriia bacterium]|jgi:GNAT superfamily N-acetyltransferase|nr:GNAT family N-acetyltransferase [Cryomorphaceae bacterium]